MSTTTGYVVFDQILEYDVELITFIYNPFTQTYANMYLSRTHFVKILIITKTLKNEKTKKISFELNIKTDDIARKVK